MNPFVLVAALAAVPMPTPPPAAPAARAEFTPIPADATRAVVFQLRVVSLQGEVPADFGAPPTDARLRALMTVVEADRLGTVLQLPRVTVIEGQTAKVFTGHSRTFTTGVEAALKDGRAVVVPKTQTVEVGSRFELSGRAVAGGAVAARVKYTDTRVGDTVHGVPLTVTTTGADGLQRVGVVTIEAPEVDTATFQAAVRVPAGRSVVIPGPTRMQEVREEVGVPVLSRIPYVSRLFTTVGYGRVPVRAYLVLSAEVVEDAPARPVAPAPRPVGR